MGSKQLQGTRSNCATIFLLSGIGLYKKDIHQYGFLSAYIDDINHEVHYEKAVYLLYKPDDMESFQAFLEKEQKRTQLLIEDYDYEGGYIVTVYKFPPRFDAEYDYFLQGKYSKFSEEYKKICPSSVQITDESGEKRWYVTLQHHIFGRSTAIKEYWEEKIGAPLTEEMECWSSPNIQSDETLNINDL